MSNQKEELEHLIQQYLDGKIGAQHHKLLQQWMASLDISDEEPTKDDLSALKARIDALVQPEPKAAVPRRLYRWVSVAASLLVVGGLIIYQFQKQHHAQNAQLSEALGSVQVHDEQQIFNARTRDSLFKLSDGTRVTLTPKSSIWLVPTFAENRRDVKLEGSAFFEVARDTARPFSVITGNIHTTALGTSFWVEVPKDQKIPTVRLLTGKVQITHVASDGKKKVLRYLHPGDVWEEGKFMAAPRKADEPTVVATKSAPPRPPRLDFHHTSLQQVFVSLERHYHQRIIFDKADIEGMTFYGNYPSSTALYDILNHVALANDLVVVYDEAKQAYQITKPN